MKNICKISLVAAIALLAVGCKMETNVAPQPEKKETKEAPKGMMQKGESMQKGEQPAPKPSSDS